MTERPPRRLAALSLRQRAGLLYGGRRERVLTEPTDALRRAGFEPVADDQHRHVRVQLPDGIDIEVGFAANFRIFGALIDTLWTGKHGRLGTSRTVLGYRFGRNARFIPTTKSEKARRRADALNADPTLPRLIERAELKTVQIVDGDGGRTVQLQPLAGTITALYFPPLPPYTVPIRPDEADAQLELLTRLLGAP